MFVSSHDISSMKIYKIIAIDTAVYLTIGFTISILILAFVIVQSLDKMKVGLMKATRGIVDLACYHIPHIIVL